MQGSAGPASLGGLGWGKATGLLDERLAPHSFSTGFTVQCPPETSTSVVKNGKKKGMKLHRSRIPSRNPTLTLNWKSTGQIVCPPPPSPPQCAWLTALVFKCCSCVCAVWFDGSPQFLLTASILPRLFKVSPGLRILALGQARAAKLRPARGNGRWRLEREDAEDGRQMGVIQGWMLPFWTTSDFAHCRIVLASAM